MRAMVLSGPGSLISSDVPIPDKKSSQVIIEVTHGGICGTDFKIYEGGITVNYPLIMGHEMIGKVVETSSGESITEGSRVIVDPVLSCGYCYFCQTNMSNLCPSGALLGRDKDGGFGEYVAVPRTNIYQLPPSICDEEAPLIQVLTTCLHAHRRLGIARDEAVVVMGLGVSGLLHLQLAKEYGANPVVCITRSAWKRDLAEKLGADETFEPGDHVSEVIKERTEGRGADVVIECAGQLPVLAEAFKLVRPGGRIMPFGIYTAKEGALPFYQFYYKEIKIINARAATSEDFPASIDLVSRGAVNLSPMVTHLMPLAALEEAVVMLNDYSAERMKIILNHKS